MDFGNALLLSALLYGLVMWVKRAVPAVEASPLLTIATVVVSAQLAVWLLRYTVWAHEQVVGGHPLDELNFGSLVAAGIFLALGATVVDQGVKMVKNVGQNQPVVVVEPHHVEAPPAADPGPYPYDTTPKP